MIEFKWPHQVDWWASARIFTYGDVHSQALVAFPWGEWEEGDDMPPPVIKPKGLPKDLSIGTIYETHRLIVKPEELTDEGRYCTAEEAKDWEQSRISGYVLDPEEWCCTTWLTVEEMDRICDAYRAFKKRIRGCPELEGAFAMMRAIEEHGPVVDGVRGQARIVWWFQR